MAIRSRERRAMPQAAGGRNRVIEARPRICITMSASEAPVPPRRLLGTPSVARLRLGSPIDQLNRLIQPTAAKLDILTADFRYVRNGKIQEFNCHIGTTTMFAQLGVLPDFASAVAASAPER